MLVARMPDKVALPRGLGVAHGPGDDYGDVATSRLIERFPDETEKRAWFLFEAARVADAAGH